MHPIAQRISLAVLLAGAPAVILPVLPAQAQAADPAVAQVQGFYDALIATMKSGGTAKARFEKLKPAIDKAFDIDAMTAIAVGPTFAAMSDADKKALIEAFDRMTIAGYAKNFDSYGGEKFTVEPASVARGTDHFVKSALKPTSGDAIPFNYRMHEAGGVWKITDIYLNGNISQMAQKRSDFTATLKASGPQGLAKKINALTDQQLG